MLKQYVKIFKRDIQLNSDYTFNCKDIVKQIKLFQGDKIIIVTESNLLIYSLIQNKILVEQKFDFPNEYGPLIEIYGKNKKNFFVYQNENDILFFEFIEKKNDKYLLKKLGQIPNKKRIYNILIKGQHLIIDESIYAFDGISDKRSEKFDKNKNVRKINTLKVYNLNDLKFILKINIPFMKDESDDTFNLDYYKPLVFTLNDETLGLFESDKYGLITYTTFNESYALNEKKILNIQPIHLNNLEFKEVRCSNKNNNKFILYNKKFGDCDCKQFFLYSSKDFKLINVINCPDYFSRIVVNEKGEVFLFPHYLRDFKIGRFYFYEIGLKKNIILNNYITYSLDKLKIPNLITPEKPQKLYIIGDKSYLYFYLHKSLTYYIIEDIINFMICFLYMFYFYRKIYCRANFSLKYLSIPLLLKLKLRWSYLHFTLLDILIILGIFLNYSFGKGLGLTFLVALLNIVLFIYYFLKYKYVFRI